MQTAFLQSRPALTFGAMGEGGPHNKTKYRLTEPLSPTASPSPLERYILFVHGLLCVTFDLFPRLLDIQ